MIDFEKIAQLIDNPNLIKKELLEDLQTLSDKFPFSPVFPQLYLKGIALYQSIDFDEKLEGYAYKIPDRKQLFLLINDASESLIDTENENVEKQRTTEKEQTTVVSKYEPVSEKITSSETIKKENETSKEVNKEEINTTDESQNKIKETEKQEQHVADELEREILATAVSSTISLEIEQESTEEFNFSDIRKLTKNDESASSVTEIEFEMEEQDETPKKEVSSFKTFTSWLSNYVDEPTSKLEPKEKKKKIIPPKKRKAEFFSPALKAQESLDESRIPVSETLAKIYVAQGNYPKAIEAYNKLILNFPEKKSFFALRIEKLKKEFKIN